MPAAARAALIARGVIPGVARVRPPIPPRTPGIVVNKLDELGRTTGAAATITRDMLGTGTVGGALDPARRASAARPPATPAGT